MDRDKITITITMVIKEDTNRHGMQMKKETAKIQEIVDSTKWDDVFLEKGVGFDMKRATELNQKRKEIHPHVNTI